MQIKLKDSKREVEMLDFLPRGLKKEIDKKSVELKGKENDFSKEALDTLYEYEEFAVAKMILNVDGKPLENESEFFDNISTRDFEQLQAHSLSLVGISKDEDDRKKE